MSCRPSERGRGGARAGLRVASALLGVAIGVGAGRSGESEAGPDGGDRPPPRVVAPVPESLREALGLSPFYRKQVDAGGIPVLSSGAAADHALLEAAYLVDHMLAHRPDVRAAMIARKARVAVMAVSEFTTDIPEHSHLRPKDYADRRARGMGGPLCVSAGEENLLSYPGDPYATENILIHEFAHGIHEIGLRAADPEFDRRLRAAYDAAMVAGLWKGTYAASSPGEYWAEGVQSWFGTNRESDAWHNHVDTREELKEYDPGLAKLLAEVFGDGPWRYRRPAERPEWGHLEGFDPSRAPRFEWPERLRDALRRRPRDRERSAGPSLPGGSAAPGASEPGAAGASREGGGGRTFAPWLLRERPRGARRARRGPRGRVCAGGRPRAACSGR